VTGVRGTFAAVAVAALALAAAGCGGGTGAPGIASLGGPGAQTTRGTSGSGNTGGPRLGGSVVMGVGNGLAFAKCMRAHGVEAFPDPNSQGEIQIGATAGIDPGSRTYRSAEQACEKVLPDEGRPSPELLAKMRLGALAFSACMRAHGVPDFPDPVFSKGGVQLVMGAGPGSDLDPAAPSFQAARRACQGKLPGIGAARGGR
jgi:hypothetical protein